MSERVANTPEVFTDSAGASHDETECRWTRSAIYPGHDACLVNPVAHYRPVTDAAPTEREPRTPTGRMMVAADWTARPVNAEELRRAILAIESEAAGAATETGWLTLDYDRMVEAGFLDAYLNIDGVKDQTEAERMLRNDMAEYNRLASGADREDGEA